jgi:hypothetical protein
MKRRFLTVVGFASGVAAASVVLRRQFGRKHDRVDVYYEDGSMISYVEGSPEAQSLLQPVHEALRAAAS